MAKIVCEQCGSSFPLDRAKDMSVCPVCGESLCGEDSPSETPKEKTKWYYYKEGGGMLIDILMSEFTPPIYTFDAIDSEDAERQLKEVMPNSPLFNNNTSDKVKCPYCFSSDVQIVPRKFSLLTGFATNRFDRVCIKCKRRF